MLKTTRLALILGLMMGSFMATPVMAAPPKEKATEKKPNLKISSFDEYLKLLIKGKDKWTPQELKDLREYAFKREKEGFEMAKNAKRDYIRDNLPRALSLFPENPPLPGSLNSTQRKEERAKNDVRWKEVVEEYGRFPEKDLAIIYQAHAIYAEKVGLYLVPKDLLTSAEIKNRGWSKDKPSILPTQSAQITRVGYLFTSRDTPKTNSD